jgi:hypothetical protein
MDSGQLNPITKCYSQFGGMVKNFGMSHQEVYFDGTGQTPTTGTTRTKIAPD